MISFKGLEIYCHWKTIINSLTSSYTSSQTSLIPSDVILKLVENQNNLEKEWKKRKYQKISNSGDFGLRTNKFRSTTIIVEGYKSNKSLILNKRS